MKISELIEHLKDFDQDALVVIPTPIGDYKYGDFRSLEVVRDLFFFDEDNNEVGREENGFIGKPCVVLSTEEGIEGYE